MYKIAVKTGCLEIFDRDYVMLTATKNNDRKWTCSYDSEKGVATYSAATDVSLLIYMKRLYPINNNECKQKQSKQISSIIYSVP